MTRLSGALDCADGILPGRVDVKATVGDLAVARVRNTAYQKRFVIGVVTDAKESGQVVEIKIAKRRPLWQYDAQVHIGPQSKLPNGRTAEQFARALPNLYRTVEDAHADIEVLRREDGS